MSIKLNFKEKKHIRLSWAIIGLLFILLLILGVWFSFAKIDVAVVGVGKVVPEGSIRKVQSMDGGVLEKIFVHDDQHVKAGQRLIEVEKTRQLAEVGKAKVRAQALQAAVARLEAEANFAEAVQYPQQLSKDRPDLIRRENSIFRQAMMSYQANMNTLEHNLAATKEEMNMLAPLVKEKIISRMEFLETKKKYNELQGNVDTAKHEFSEKAFAELSEKRAALEGVNNELVALEDRTKKGDIDAPVTGYVNDLAVRHAGEILQPGQRIMDVVPAGDTLEVEVRVKPNDVAFIRSGMAVIVRVSAYDFTIYGGLKGKVKSISPNTIRDEEGNHYFNVKIAVSKNYLLSGGRKLFITPGMTVDAQIITGKQTIMRYILKPILRAKSNALRES